MLSGAEQTYAGKLCRTTARVLQQSAKHRKDVEQFCHRFTHSFSAMLPLDVQASPSLAGTCVRMWRQVRVSESARRFKQVLELRKNIYETDI